MASGVSNTDPTALVFRLHEGAPDLVREVLLERGWKEYDKKGQEEGDWNLYWRASAFRSSDYDNILPWQRLNHNPKTAGITRKDCLARNLKRMRGTFGSALYDFSPTAFILPNDYSRFLAEYTKLRLKHGGRSGYWICKPVDLSRGRGIYIFKDIKDLAYNSSVIVQKYISNPLLIAGYKFDLRIYVCVKSFQPLTIYIHQQGLVRFATEKYNLSSLDNRYSHLTNTSINKFGPFYTTNKDKVGPGCKWTLSKFRCFLQSQGINELLFWQKINNIVTLTLLTMVTSVPPSPNCVELFGFDILIDARYKPWLLEVNYSPALTLDCQADVTVKKGLLNDLFDLMNYSSIDSLRQSGYFKQKYKRPCYLGSQSLQVPGCLLPNSTCKHQQANKTGNSIHTTFAGNTSYFPEVKMNRIRSGRNCISDTSSSAPNMILLPHSKTAAVIRNRQVGHALTHMTEAIQWSEVTDQELERDKGDLSKHDSQPQVLRRPAAVGCKLPAIHLQKYNPPKFPGVCKENCTPALRVGDFILTFPFNEVTLKASQDKLNVKTAVHEVHKLISQVASGLRHNEESAREDVFDRFKEQNNFGSLLWGPTNPPLLSEFHFSNQLSN